MSPRRARGFALVVVLLVLAALVALATPFLLSMRSGDRVAVHRTAQARARLAARGGVEHARRFLHDTYPSRDASPLADGTEELSVPPIPKAVQDLRDPRGTILSVRAEDEQGKIHLNTAPPALLGALFGGRAFLARDAKADDVEIFLDDASGFPEEGFLWVGNEIVHYAAREGGKLTGCTRGVLSGDGRYAKAREHESGALVLDERARAIALHRIGERADGRWRPFDSPPAVVGLEAASPAEPYGRSDFEKVAPLVTVWSDRPGSPEWTAPVRVEEVQKDGDEVWRVLRVAGSRDFPPGATVRIAFGKAAFHTLVLDANPNEGLVVLEAGLPTVPDPFRATISALVRHPMNVNSASPLALRLVLEGIARRSGGSSEFVSAVEARALVDRIVAARAERPIAGMEDLYRRVLEPAQVDGAIAETDLETVWRNAENPNDAWLTVSSVPFSFASGDVYAIEAAASVNARSGVERARHLVREVLAVRPQEDLFLALGHQAAFDEHLRLSRAARFWCTGPANTSMWDGPNATFPNVPPSRAVPSLGLAGLESQAFASDRPEDSWLQPWPARRFGIGPYQDRIEHFDFDRNPLGHDPRQRAVSFGASGSPVGIAGAGNVPYPGSMEAWFEFDGAPADGSILLDLGASSTDRNRISLLVEGTDLVLRAYDGGGEDSGAAFSTPDRDAAEVHFPASGLAPHVAHHLLASFRGTRPSDLHLQIDGFRKLGTQTYGLTRLSGNVSTDGTTIPIESAKGFPTSGPFVVRIGGEENAPGSGEIAEVRLSGGALEASWIAAGSSATSYAGGRGARAFAPTAQGGLLAAFDPALTTARSHRRGEKVELYGYVAPLASNLPLGGGTLDGALGRWTVAYVQNANGIEAIQTLIQGTPVPLGTGIYKTATEWDLQPVDGSESGTFMDAFPASGGYALVFQLKDFNANLNNAFLTPLGDPIFAAELVRFSGKSGNKLLVPASGRGQVTARFPAAAGQSTGFVGAQGQPHGFLLHPSGGLGFYCSGALVLPPFNMDTDERFRIYVVPLSVRGVGVDSNGTTYLVPPAPSGSGGGAPRSEYAQVYDRTNEALTEWIRYDEILGSEFVRTQPNGLRSLRALIEASPACDGPAQRPQPLIGPPILEAAAAAPPPPPTAPAPAPPAAQASTVYQIGTRESASAVQLMETALGFRGVHGTFTHPQAANADLIPVFRTASAAGRPGRHDRVAVLEPGATSPPLRFTVNWAALNDETDGDFLVAFKERTGNLYARTTGLQGNAIYDSRNYARLVKSPSGELPVQALRFAAGGSFDGAGGAANAILDEVAFTTGTAPGTAYSDLSLGRLVLSNTGGITDADTDLRFNVNSAAYPHGVYGLPTALAPLSELPADAGVLLLDQELMIYRLVTASSGEVRVAANGRGALGSEKSAHAQGATAVFLDHWVASRLAASASAATSALTLVDPAGFPPHGTARVEDELLHWTALRNDALLMPNRSEEPGADDQKGDGLLRGRFGTSPAAHSADAVVLLWPIRYWDRARARADAPELSFYQASVRAEDAFFRRLLWEEEIPFPSVDVVALARVDEAVPWDADPEREKDLRLFRDPKEKGFPVEIGRQGSRLDVRFSVEYLPGAFDPLQGASDGWKSAPRIRTIVVDYLAPERTLRREETDG